MGNDRCDDAGTLRHSKPHAERHHADWDNDVKGTGTGVQPGEQVHADTRNEGTDRDHVAWLDLPHQACPKRCRKHHAERHRYELETGLRGIVSEEDLVKDRD